MRRRILLSAAALVLAGCGGKPDPVPVTSPQSPPPPAAPKAAPNKKAGPKIS